MARKRPAAVPRSEIGSPAPGQSIEFKAHCILTAHLDLPSGKVTLAWTECKGSKVEVRAFLKNIISETWKSAHPDAPSGQVAGSLQIDCALFVAPRDLSAEEDADFHDWLGRIVHDAVTTGRVPAEPHEHTGIFTLRARLIPSSPPQPGGQIRRTGGLDPQVRARVPQQETTHGADDGHPIPQRAPKPKIQTTDALPVASRLQNLPVRARLALAARCGRRARPLLKPFWPDASPETIRKIEGIISLIEEEAAGGNTPGWRAASHLADLPIVPDCARQLIKVFELSCRAAEAAEAIAVSETATYRGKGQAARDRADKALTKATAEVAMAAFAAVPETLRIPAAKAIARDFEYLRDVATREGWTDKKGVSLHFFGSLWPEGPPEGWRAPPPGGRASGPGELSGAS